MGVRGSAPSPGHSSGARGGRALSVLAAAAALALVMLAVPASAGPTPAQTSQQKLTATPLTPSGRVEGAKSASARLARTDRSLLGQRSTAPVRVVVKLDYDSLAAYGGQIRGLPATSPSVTHKGLDLRGDAARRYSGYVQGIEQRFLDAMRARVPAASAGARLRTTYGGVALTLPSNQVAELLKLPGVVAVQRDALAHPLTDSSPAFIGAPTIYNQLGQTADDAGKGVIFGVLDTGAWPEHPSYIDHGNLPAPPPKADGTPRTCNFGDNPLTPANDPFACNRKLISGQPFLATYNAVLGDEFYPTSARDSDGHGTHTSTTTAGGPVTGANPLGINRGDIHGIAPGAHVAVYKVCGTQGCFGSDSAAAVAQAILDGVNVINFSISGGVDPYTDVVELAFLDAFAAGITVSASAGNDGPGAATVNHNSPWVMTVAASTQTRTFRSTATLTGGGATLQISGATITSGISTPAPVVLASAAPYSDPLCLNPAPAGLFTGKIVACKRGPGRVLKGFNVRAGGAVGMILYNSFPFDLFTDNHWIPTVHVEKPEADQLLAFLAAHPDATASWPQGSKTTWQGDRVTFFSSRGPGGDWLKPDVTAPGNQILAGNTPAPRPDPVLGPPGNLFQVISGTSMSSPHAAGSAVLVKALHPTWTPAQVKSALETTAKTAGVTKSDGVAPADPFDVGGGRVDLTKAGDPGLTFNETAANYAAAAATPLNRIDLNTPSVNAPTMPGVITTTRTARNVSNSTLAYTVSTQAPSGASISVSPAVFTLRPGQQVRLNITISAPSVAQGQYFGRINLDQVGGPRDLHLPVAFFKRQGIVTLAQSCAPTTIRFGSGRSTCSVTVQNNSLSPADVSSVSTTGLNLPVTAVTGATKVNDHRVTASATLAARQPDAPHIAPGQTPAGYIPLDLFGVTPIAVGDEQALNFNTPAFTYAGQTFNRLGVVSDGYLVAGGAEGADVNFVPQSLPDPARPNGVLAPFWTDMDGTGAPGVFAVTLTDGVNDWVVIEWRLNFFGTTNTQVFQAWIGINGTEDITFTYDPAHLPQAPPPGVEGLTVGAENSDGSAGDQIAPTASETPPTEDLRVTSTPGAPGGSLTYSFQVKGLAPVGTLGGTVRTDMDTPLVRGTTTDVDTINVTG
jgi:Subtilase family/Fibronectin type-III domain/PA domain